MVKSTIITPQQSANADSPMVVKLAQPDKSIAGIQQQQLNDKLPIVWIFLDMLKPRRPQHELNAPVYSSISPSVMLVTVLGIAIYEMALLSSTPMVSSVSKATVVNSSGLVSSSVAVADKDATCSLADSWIIGSLTNPSSVTPSWYGSINSW